MIRRGWKKDLIVLLVSTLVTVLVWAGVEIYQAYIKTDMPQGVEKHLEPFDTSLDTEVFDKLKSRNP